MSRLFVAVVMAVLASVARSDVGVDQESKAPLAPVRMRLLTEMENDSGFTARTGTMEAGHPKFEPPSRLKRPPVLRRASTKQDGLEKNAAALNDKSETLQNRRMTEGPAAERIIGGTPLDTIGQYKWMSLLLIEITANNSTQRNFICNGVLIALDFVLTEAACLWNPTTGQFRDTLYGASVGVRCRRADNCGQGYTLFTSPANLWLVHPDFDYNVISARHDVALIRLKNPATTMPTSALAVPDDGRSYYGGTDSLQAMVSSADYTDLQILSGGWILPRRFPDRMRKASVMYVPQEECEASWNLVTGGLDGVLCTKAMTAPPDDDGSNGDGGIDIGLGQGLGTSSSSTNTATYEFEPNPNGGNICDGDGGAPIFLEGATSVNVTDSFFGDVTVVKQDVVVGIAALTFPGCNDAKLNPDMHARVADSYEWIHKTVCKKSRVTPKPEWCATASPKKRKCKDSAKTVKFQVDVERPKRQRNCKFVKKNADTLCDDSNLPDIPRFCPKTCNQCP